MNEAGDHAPASGPTIAPRAEISAFQASRKYGLKLPTLCRAIDKGLAPGTVRMAGARQGDARRSRPSYTVDPAELEAWLESRRGRTCTYPTCTAEALVFSDHCFKHTGHVTLPGHAPKGSEERARMTRGKLGVKRPDVAERIAAMHADSKKHAMWGLSTMEGRLNGARTIAKRSDDIPGRTLRAWKNRVNGHKGGVDPVSVSDKTRAEIWRQKDRGFGRRTIPAMIDDSSVTEEVIRRVLHEPRPA